MKKILICACFLLASTSIAFAADSYDMDLDTAKKQGLRLFGVKPGETATVNSPVISKTSNGVGLAIKVETNGTSYAHATQHKQGSKAYGTAKDSNAIYTIDVATVGTPKITTLTATTVTDFTNWTAM